MKQFIFSLILILMVSTASIAQPFAALDKSPMDRAYFPHNFAHDRKAGEKAIIRVTYSRPMMNGRVVMGNLVPYGKVWRAGANESAEIKFYQDVKLGGKDIKAGTYSLFAIANEKDWTIILSSDLDYWGAFSYKEANDVARVTGSVAPLETAVESFTIQFEKKAAQQGTMKMAWDKTVVEVPFSY